jgi:hypothetical protein
MESGIKEERNSLKRDKNTPNSYRGVICDVISFDSVVAKVQYYKCLTTLSNSMFPSWHHPQSPPSFPFPTTVNSTAHHHTHTSYYIYFLFLFTIYLLYLFTFMYRMFHVCVEKLFVFANVCQWLLPRLPCLVNIYVLSAIIRSWNVITVMSSYMNQIPSV